MASTPRSRIAAPSLLFKSEAKELFLARLNSLARTVRDRQQIDNERRRLQGILASVGDGVYGVDAEGRIQFVNPAAVDILGYGAAEDLVGRIAFETFHYAFEDGTTMPRQASFLDTCYASGSRVPAWQTVFWTASRRAVPVECTVFPMQIDGLREGSVVAFRDVSARRMLERRIRSCRGACSRPVMRGARVPGTTASNGRRRCRKRPRRRASAKGAARHAYRCCRQSG